MASMAAITEYSETQQEQVNVLESIYGENFHRVQGTKSAWQKRHNLAFEIRLDALNDKDLSVLLHIELPPEWPKIAPLFKLKDSENVRPHVSDKIRGLLKTVKPDNDIYTICADMQEVMEDAAESKVRRKTMPALDEERANKEAEGLRKAEEEKKLLAKKDEEQKAQANATMAKKVASLQFKMKKATGSTEKSGEDSPVHLELPNPVVHFEDTMSITDKNGEVTYFTDVWGTYSKLKTEEKKVTVVTPIVANAVTARRLLLKQIHIDAAVVSHPSRLLGEVRDIENLLQELKNRKHESVVDVFGYKVVINHDALAIKSIDLTILSAYANKESLAEILDIYDSLQGSRIISWTTQLLEALAFYDALGHVHPAVHLNNVLLFRTDEGHISVKLSDGYGADLRSLVMQTRSASGIKEPAIPTGWRAPELNQANPARTNKTCLWDLGVVIMQMVSGKKVVSEYTSPNNYLKFNNITDDLYDLIQKMCALDQGDRSNAYDLTSAEFLRGDGNLFISTSHSGMSPPYFAGRRESATVHADSVWKSQWEEVGFLGSGGFGKVVKARNRTDLRLCAVKIIRCSSDEDVTELLREIKLLSSLNSPRVVRYFSSWVESERSADVDFKSSSEYDTPDFQEVPSTGKEWVGGADYLSGRGDNIQFQSSSRPYAGQQQPQSFFRAAGEISSGSEDDGGAETDGAANYQHQIERQTVRPNIPKTLYIVMELCETHSLKNMIQRGLLKEIPEIWRLFGQIIEGLAYIHSRGLIHRDLKPDNIFLTETNDIRIGDFGLATRGKLESIAGKSPMNQASEYSRSLGTALYVAPELKSGADGAYTSKVDMYSTGIMLLEMCCPTSTSTERLYMIRSARRREPVLPLRLLGQSWGDLHDLVYRLLNHDQHERPSASDIVASGIIPEPVGNEAIKRYVAGLVRGDPTQYADVVQQFFSTMITPAQDLAWDSGLNEIVPAREAVVSSAVNLKLRTVFQRHGAVDGKREILFPLSPIYANPATYLDKSGITLQLLYDMTLPFARLLARNNIDHTRHYALGVVYRGADPGGRPSPLSEASFDIVSYSAKDLSIKDAEVLKICDEILAEFPSLKQNKAIVLFLNHSELLEILLRYCGIEAEQWKPVKDILSMINTESVTWKRIEKDLRNPDFKLPRASIQQLAQFNFQDDLQNAHKKLQKMLTSPSDLAKLQQMFTRLLEVQQHAETMKVETKIVINPLANYSERLYNGSIMFQCVDTAQKKMLAVGGRYDHLIHSLEPEVSTRGSPRAVGLRLNTTELANRLAPEMTVMNKSSKQEQKLQRCDVIITSFEEDTLHTTCLEIAADLWANSIRAELTDLYSSFEELSKAYKKDGQYLVLTVRKDSNAIGGVALRARALGKQEDDEIKRTELITWLKDELKAPENDSGRAKLRRETSVGEQSLSVDTRSAEIVIIQPKHKGKKTNRQALADDAGLTVREEARGMVADAPIMVVEVNKEVLEAMRATRIDSAESWKAFLQACPAEETRYLKEVQEGLEAMKEGGKEGVWLYSSKIRACVYYSL